MAIQVEHGTRWRDAASRLYISSLFPCKTAFKAATGSIVTILTEIGFVVKGADPSCDRKPLRECYVKGLQAEIAIAILRRDTFPLL